MSVSAISWAFGQSHVPTTPRFVLVAMADYADHEGVCWPAVATLEGKTGLRERAVRAALKELRELGVIVPLTNGLGGKHTTTRYQLQLHKAAPPASSEPGKGAPDAGNDGDRVQEAQASEPAKGAPDACKGARGAGNPASGAGKGAPRAPEPSLTTIEPSGNRHLVAAAPQRVRETDPKGHRLPEDWAPSRADCAFAAELGLDADEVAAEFRDYWNGVPGARGRKLDWSATFRNSVRMQAKRRPQRRQPESKLAWMMEPGAFDFGSSRV